jgi:hypothetical protein
VEARSQEGTFPLGSPVKGSTSPLMQVYSDLGSSLRTMRHNHPDPRDAVLIPIQETSGKPHSPTLLGLDIQDRGTIF